MAKMTTISPEVLKQIAERREWIARPDIAISLVRNPKVPTPIAVKLLDHVSPGDLRQLAKDTRTREPVQQVAPLRGKVTPHHRFMIKLHLAQIDSPQDAVRALEARMGDARAPLREQVARLTTIPGVSDVVAQVIASEVGLDMTRFPTAGHLISWAGLCPRLDESAGKRRSTRVRKGAPWLKTTLVTAHRFRVARDGMNRASNKRMTRTIVPERSTSIRCGVSSS